MKVPKNELIHSKDANTSENIDSTELVEQKEQVLIDLSNNDMLDLSDLSEENQQAIALKAQEAKLELKKKAGEALLDIQGTKANLDTFNQTVRDGTDAGTHVTLTHTQTTSTGRTEVVMGNTDKAASGKVSRSGAGLKDNQMTMVIIGAVVLVIIAIVVSG
tara:strand:- start:251 stop:733 length:483 start_codon:yes stop_codon:yes gene_type:complete